MKRKLIAVIEDNEDNRLLLRAFLADQYDLVEYESGAAALRAFQHTIPDLVLLDISLPGLDGVEVLHRLRSDQILQHLYVIALTAHAMAGDRAKFLSAGFNDYLAKPLVDEAMLFDAIRRAFQNSRVGEHAALVGCLEQCGTGSSSKAENGGLI